MGYWLSFGGGVNSTALAVLCFTGQLPQYQDARILFADTLTERPETYRYIEDVFQPWLATVGKQLEVTAPAEGVLERWQRLGVTGSRILRTCTVHGKIKPLERYILDRDIAPVQLVGIDAGEPRRVRPPHKDDKIPKIYPLVQAGIDRPGCIHVIQTAGLPAPPKSGCWCCPFLRVGEILRLTRDQERISVIASLEEVVVARYPTKRLWQFRDRPVSHWIARAKQEDRQLSLDLDLDENDTPCACYDGE